MQVDAITGHSTLQASDLGLPRNSTDLMSGTSGIDFALLAKLSDVVTTVVKLTQANLI